MLNPLNPRRDPFIRSFKSLVRAERERDPVLHRKLRRRWTAEQIFLMVFTSFGCVMLSAAAIVGILAVCRDYTHLSCQFVSVIATLTGIFCISLKFANCVKAAAYPLDYVLLPLDEKEFDALKRRKLMQPPLAYFAVVAVLLGIVAYTQNALDLRNGAVIVILSLLCASATWAFVLWTVRLGRGIPPIVTLAGLVAFLASILAFFMFVNKDGPSQWFLNYLANNGESFALFTPAGWAVGLLSSRFADFSQNWNYTIYPLAALSASLPFAFRRLERSISYGEYLALDLIEEGTIDLQVCQNNLTSTDLEVYRTDFPHAWKQDFHIPRVGWLERLFLRFLSTEEKTSIEHLRSHFPQWTLNALRTIPFLLVSAVLFYPMLGANVHEFIEIPARCFVVGSIIAFIVFLFPDFTGLSCLKNQTNINYQKSPTPILYLLYAHPFSIRDNVRIIQKAAILRFVVFAPFLIALGGAITYFDDGTFMRGAEIAVKILLMATFGFPNLILFAIEPFHKPGFLLGLKRVAIVTVFALLLLIPTFVLAFVAPFPYSWIGIVLFVLVCRWARNIALRMHDRPGG